MKLYQSKIFKIIMSIIAIIVIFKYSFLIFLTGIGLVVYLNKKNCKFKSFHKAGKIILSCFIILFSLLLIGIKNAPTTDKSITANSNLETSSEAAKTSDNSEAKEDTNSKVTAETKSEVTEQIKPEETKKNTDAQQATTKDEKTQSANASTASTNASPSNSNSLKSSDSTSTNSTTNNTTETSDGDENTIVYYVPNSNVYHLSKSDPKLKKSKNIYKITLKNAKAKGMHQSKSKADN